MSASQSDWEDPAPLWQSGESVGLVPDRCLSAGRGHGKQWIPYIRAHAELPMRPAHIADLAVGGWFSVTDTEGVGFLWWHDPLGLAEALGGREGRVLRIGDDLILPMSPRRPGWHLRIHTDPYFTPCEVGP